MTGNKDTKYDKSIRFLKNNPLVISLLLFFSVTIAISQFIEAGKAIREAFSRQEIPKTQEDTIQKDKVEKAISNPSVRHLNEIHSTISGRLIDKDGNGIAEGIIQTENGEKSLTDESGYFEIKIHKRDGQLKVKLHYRKNGYLARERYIGVEQHNIILEL